MKKVIHLNASSAGGAFVVAQRLSDALNKEGSISSRHLVFSGNPGKNYSLWVNSWWKRKYAFFLHALEKLDFLRFEKDRNVRFAFSHGRTGINIAANQMIQDADIIHLHWINKGFISLHGLESLLALEKPIVWTCHDMWPFTGGCYHTRGCDHYLMACGDCPYLRTPGEKDLSHRVFKEKARIFAGSNVHWVSPSAWLAEKAKSSGIHKNIQINVIPNLIDVTKFGIRDKAALKIKMGIDHSKKVILFAAANLKNAFKGYSYFVETMHHFGKIYSDEYAVVVIGAGDTLMDSEIDSHFIYFGSIDDEQNMNDFYSLADVYITTSLEENLPTTIMESLACGTPVGAFNVGGIPEMIQDGVHGVLVEKYETEKLAQGIKKLLELNLEATKNMNMQCRDKAVSDYSENVIVSKYLEIYNNL